MCGATRACAPDLSNTRPSRLPARAAFQRCLSRPSRLHPQWLPTPTPSLLPTRQGLLPEAVAAARMLLPRGSSVLTLWKHQRKVRTYRRRWYHGGETHGRPAAAADPTLFVLVDENSASAAEIFAGALRANGNAVVIGTSTYGKGASQALAYMSDGSAIRFTSDPACFESTRPPCVRGARRPRAVARVPLPEHANAAPACHCRSVAATPKLASHGVQRTVAADKARPLPCVLSQGVHVARRFAPGRARLVAWRRARRALALAAPLGAELGVRRGGGDARVASCRRRLSTRGLAASCGGVL